MEERFGLRCGGWNYAAPTLLAPKEIATASNKEQPRDQQKRNYRAMINSNASQSQYPAQQRLVQSSSGQLNEEDLQLRMSNTLQPRADWRAIKKDLLKEIGDLIPDAQLEPMDKSRPMTRGSSPRSRPGWWFPPPRLSRRRWPGTRRCASR